MRGLRMHLTPFAPDQSGATSVLFELGGIICIVDAGGCTGNVCGFDEPRWQTTRSAVFSAGLRDMDAIMGRDDKLIAELADAATKIEANFAALIGTPVPAVIGTDYKALERMAKRKCGLETIAIDANGCELYDRGAEKATTALFRRFATERFEVEEGRIGVLGTNPLDLSVASAQEIFDLVDGAVCYGMGSTFDDVVKAASAEKNLVVANSGLKAARLLERRFETPYEIGDPRAKRYAKEIAKSHDLAGKRVLVISGQITANSIADELLSFGVTDTTVATWFAFDKDLARPQDVRLEEEDDLLGLVRDGSFDLVVGDERQFAIFADLYDGETYDLPQFALSGRLQEV